MNIENLDIVHKYILIKYVFFMSRRSNHEVWGEKTRNVQKLAIKFHEDWTKIVDFLLMADFERVSFFFSSEFTNSADLNSVTHFWSQNHTIQAFTVCLYHRYLDVLMLRKCSEKSLLEEQKSTLACSIIYFTLEKKFLPK